MKQRTLPKGKCKKVLALIRDELGGQIMRQCIGLRPKTYSLLKGNGDEYKKSKGTKKVRLKKKT